MKLIKKILMVIPFVLPYMLLSAQTIMPLKIGDKVPDIYFAKMLNHISTSGKLSDFKGKAIIIDMWFHSCIPCIGGMPYMDSLQKEFKNDLQVLPVTWESQADIEEFWKKNVMVNKIKFTQVVEDSITRKLFPAVSFPHQIWIDKSGTVVAITDSKNSTRENIKKLIENDKINVPEKREEMDGKIRWGIEPLMNIRYEENKSNLLFYSYFSKYRKELNGSASYQKDTVNNLIRWKFSNYGLLNLYHNAYANTTGVPFNLATRVIRRDHKTLKSRPDFKTHTDIFCYDVMYKDTTLNSFGKFMIPDLDRFFGLKSREVKKKIMCYVISPNGKGSRYRQTIDPDGKRHFYNLTLQKNTLLSVSKMWPSHLNTILTQFTPLPLLFEMGTDKLINFEVVWNLDDLKKMNTELTKFDLQIEKKKRRQKVIILEDAP
nr:TlpA family protein disulfide reductase [Pedobacter sp. ASV2]